LATKTKWFLISWTFEQYFAMINIEEEELPDEG
jgi:hypothetical protein